MLARIEDYVAANLEGDFGIRELAALAGLSRFQFARAFRASVGSSPHRFVMARRIERARAMLDHTDRALHEIAAATGFSDQSHLTREIKRRYGLPPGALRAGRARIFKTGGSRLG